MFQDLPAQEGTMESDLSQQNAAQVENAIATFTSVLENLQASHTRLEERARRVDAELCAANEALGQKVHELDRVKQHLESVLTSIPTGAIVYDTEGRIVRANDAALTILGVTRTDLLGVGTVAGLSGPAADGRETEVECADGVTRVLVRRYRPVHVEGGIPAGGVEVIEDQSELVRATERLHRLDKTAALGTMAGGIAHEIRNPLHAIQGFAQLLCREADGDSRATRHAVRIQEGVNEIESIVASMLGIAGEGELRVETFNARALVREAVEAVLSEREAPDLWTMELIGPAATIQADRIKLRQAVRNLVANACDAQPAGGPVRVETMPAKNGVTITVTDAGPGIPSKDIERICDPFFTTRAEGTGMGLALVQRVAELHGGVLELQAPNSAILTPAGQTPLNGACFALTIPTQTVSASGLHAGAPTNASANPATA
ncbi:Sporulation kinase E [Planctomycetes bacterium Poly30]|uniref:histidine kinase n=2 Tax=Saltatorellus ferox TaxID=2528018 RepID=A0A518ELN3_9BACT|nr:Sporulation kinase E [Planctomycetes bacterium Poly30]